MNLGKLMGIIATFSSGHLVLPPGSLYFLLITLKILLLISTRWNYGGAIPHSLFIIPSITFTDDESV